MSLNHHFWGDVSAWLIGYVAGVKLNPRADDCDYVEISPNFISALTFAEGEFIHEKGKIVSCWERAENGIRLRVSLPSGICAKLVLPKNYACDGLVKRDDCATRNAYDFFDHGVTESITVYEIVCGNALER